MMKTLTIALCSIVLLFVCAPPANGQPAWTTTTLASAITSANTTSINIVSNTNVLYYTTSAPTGPGGPAAAQSTYLYVDQELMAVNSTPILQAAGNYRVEVRRGIQGTAAAVHLAAATVYVGQPSWFITARPYGVAPALAAPTSFLINVRDGTFWGVDAARRWKRVVDAVYFVPAKECAFIPTTLTETTTFPVAGLGTARIPVINSVTNAAAGTDTLTCFFSIPGQRSSGGKGITILDIVALVGSQTVAPTGAAVATLASITFATPATGALANTVTPVSIGGTVTNLVPTALTAVTTAGAFVPVKSTFAPAVTVESDRQVLVYSLLLTQSAASAMTVNSPGLLVHYAASAD